MDVAENNSKAVEIEIWIHQTQHLALERDH
jgi:hypothetical protein